MRSFTALLVLSGALLSERVSANNIQVSNTTLTGNTGTQVMVQFDIGWENSWRGGGVSNWDAAWVFVKYKLPGDGGFSHMLLEPNGHVAPSGSLVETGLISPALAHNATTNPAVGVFIRRDADGTGTFTANGVQLRWNYGALGFAFEDIREVRVYAIEMAYINQGAFYLGTGGTETNAFRNGSTGLPYQIFQEGGTINIASSQLWADGEIEAGTLPPAFPKGYAASYMMKYEMSQQQYVDFLNSLPRSQQVSRVESDISPGLSVITNTFVMTATTTGTDRNGIRCDGTIDPQNSITFYCDANENGTGGEPDDGQWVSCNNLMTKDVLAYLDWSGLRPMTELEYEKACRGPLPPVMNEYPWRTTSIVGPAAYTLSDPFTANEGIASGYSTSSGNATYANGESRRSGIFAAHPSNNGRTSAGAGYYGNMDLAGNQYEVTISAGNAAGRAYTGIHGNGALSLVGGHDVVNWPSLTTNNELGARGGAQSTPAADVGRLRLSDRFYGASLNNTVRIESIGGRGIRTAP